MKPTRSLRAGFTLVELLVAILIFAIMTSVSYRTLNGLLETRQRIDRDAARWREVALLFMRMKQDLTFALPRPARDAAGLVAPSFSGGIEPAQRFGAPLVFTRSGESSLAAVPAAPRRVGYRLNGQSVEMLLWPVLDQAPHSVPSASPVLDKVAELRVRFLDPGGGWHENWPDPTAVSIRQRHADLPVAVQVTLRLESGETLVRLFALPVLAGMQ